MKILGLADDVLREVANVPHEGVARQLRCSISRKQTPFACQLWAGQFRHRILQEHDRLDSLVSVAVLCPVAPDNALQAASRLSTRA